MVVTSISVFLILLGFVFVFWNSTIARPLEKHCKYIEDIEIGFYDIPLPLIGLALWGLSLLIFLIGG